MNMDLESRLRAALRPVRPNEEFSRKLIANVMAGHRPEQHRFAWRRAPATAWWLSAGLAASLLLAVGVRHHEEQVRQRGMEARREVVEALRVTSQKLNLAYEAVQSQASSLTEDKPGA
jgi:hypothetical protein